MSLKLTPRRCAQLDVIWRNLCRLVGVVAVMAFTGLWWILPSWLIGVLIAPGLLVMLVIVVAWCADSTRSLTSPAVSTES